jgi:DNA-binding NtrC family response regulator
LLIAIPAGRQRIQWRRERTTAVLGISLKTLYNRLKECAAEKVAPRRREDGDGDTES